MSNGLAFPLLTLAIKGNRFDIIWNSSNDSKVRWVHLSEASHKKKADAIAGLCKFRRVRGLHAPSLVPVAHKAQQEQEQVDEVQIEAKRA